MILTMTNAMFEAIFNEQIEQCRKVLFLKAQEYATDEDRLHNFKLAAALTQGTPEQALWGFAVKHLVSISDMVKDGEYPKAVWDEKIGDAINYLILLRAQVIETDSLRLQASIISANS